LKIPHCYWDSYTTNTTDEIGVEYSSGSGDYAEWLRRKPNERVHQYGEIVGIKGGLVSLNTQDADQVMVVSRRPIVLGNAPQPHQEKYYEKIDRLDGIIDKEYLYNLVPVEINKLYNKKFIFHPAGNKPNKNTKLAIEAFLENDYEDIDIKITVPKKLWFESLHVEVEANYDESCQTSVRFLIKNGFLTEEHTDFCSNLEEELVKDFDDIFNNYQSGANDKEFRNCTDSWILERADAVESGDDLIFYIKQVEFSVMDNVEKNVVLELDEETAAAIDEQLNDE
jgi:hypothetical protein